MHAPTQEATIDVLLGLRESAHGGSLFPLDLPVGSIGTQPHIG